MTTRWGRFGTPPTVNVAGSGFTAAIFNSTFPSAWWRHTFITAAISNPQGATRGETAFAQSPNNNEYAHVNFPQNQETLNWTTFFWTAPWNWKTTSAIKARAYWYVTAEGSHGASIDWQWSIRSIGNTETLKYNQTYTLNGDVETTNDLLYITDELSYTPYTDGSALAVNDFWHIMFRRKNDSASGAAKLLGIRLSWEVDATIAVP